MKDKTHLEIIQNYIHLFLGFTMVPLLPKHRTANKKPQER